MTRRTVLRSAGAVLLPAMILLSGCPQKCAPDPAQPAPAAAPPQGAQPAPAPAAAPPQAAQPAPAPAAPVAPPVVPPAGALFFEDFRSAAGFYDRFDVGFSGVDPTVHQRGHVWPGDHNHACEGPTTLRDVHAETPAEWVWWCAPGGADTGHVMTSLDASGYTILWFAPKGYLRDVDQVCWDQNVTLLGGGKWTQVMIVTRADAERTGGDLGFTGPDFQNPDGPSTKLHPTNGTVGTRFKSGQFGFFEGQPSQFTTAFHDGSGYGDYADKAARYRHCMTDNDNGTVTLTQARVDGTTRIETVPGRFPPGEVRVVFQDDTYDAIKHGGIPDRKTWHWDNISIS